MRGTNNSTTTRAFSSLPPKDLIRGVNIGGWLVLERYITPYQFAITECHVHGDFCWYNGSISAPPNAKPCPQTCTDRPIFMPNIYNSTDYPLDEWHLAKAFGSHPSQRNHGTEWLNYHFENFVSMSDLQEVKDAGITHVRVPLPHWILGDVEENEPWIVGKRWYYFRRFVGWCREIGLQVWPNIHTAPGSQNGFDNSGLQRTNKTCEGWSKDDDDVADENHYPRHIARSLNVIDSVTKRIALEGMSDVITGFGLLNEPYGDCNTDYYKDFMDEGLEIVRRNLGNDVSVFVSDLFWAPQFNDGKWWLDPQKYQNTYLDSHYYNLFDQPQRGLSPKKHLEAVCHPSADAGHDLADCCWQGAPKNNVTNPSRGVGRIVAEWSVAYDAMPGDLLKVILQGIQTHGVAALLHRQLQEDEKRFLRRFAEAQIVAYEKADIPGLAHGWFFWSLKMEGGAFIEWDFLRGVREGWLPKIQPPDMFSETVYGSCQDILDRTDDNMTIVHPYPEWWWYTNDTYWDPEALAYKFDAEHQKLNVSANGRADDDYSGNDDIFVSIDRLENIYDHSLWKLAAIIGLFIVYFCWRSSRRSHGNRKDYTEIDDQQPGERTPLKV